MHVNDSKPHYKFNAVRALSNARFEGHNEEELPDRKTSCYRPATAPCREVPLALRRQALTPKLLHDPCRAQASLRERGHKCKKKSWIETVLLPPCDEPVQRSPHQRYEDET